jgi:cell wall-associated NlpC family hydrolase
MRGVLLLQKAKHGHALKLVLLCMLMVVGFKDSGIFVQDYTHILNGVVAAEFKAEEKVEVAKENAGTYFVYKDGTYFEVPKDKMIRTTRQGDKYTVLSETALLAKQDGESEIIRIVTPGEELVLASYDHDFGRFVTTAGLNIGYIKLEKVTASISENISYGISNVSTIVRNEKSLMVLIKGDTVGVVDFIGGKYTLVDSSGLKYSVDKSAVALYKTTEQVTRSAERASSDKLTALIKGAYSLMGKPYVYGSAGPNSFDCSGFTYYLYKTQLGITLPRSSYLQPGSGIRIEKSELRPGDLVFFGAAGSRISHVGLYIGDGNMIHASSGKGVIRIDTINSGWYYSRYKSAARVIN